MKELRYMINDINNYVFRSGDVRVDSHRQLVIFVSNSELEQLMLKT